LIPWDDIAEIEHCGSTVRRVQIRLTIEHDNQGTYNNISGHMAKRLEDLPGGNGPISK
jgi:hypothetical protein